MVVAARSVGRRSKRLMAIRGTAPGGVLSLSSKNDETTFPETIPSAVVPITPSPAKKISPKTPSTVKRKRKRSLASPAPKAAVVPDAIVSRRLSLDDKMIENNDLELTTDMVAAINPSQEFIDLKVSPEELRPSNTLTTGQCFHWKVVYPTKQHDDGGNDSSPAPMSSAWGTHDETEWVGTLRLRLFGSYESVVVVVRELPDTTLYRPLATTRRSTATTEEEEQNELHRELQEYFQLDACLLDLYEEWSGACPRLSRIAECIPGVRIIKQDPWECLISFICSSNNNIPRITKMLASIRREYGQPLLRIPAMHNGGEENRTREYYQFRTFPGLEELSAEATDEDLRGKCGMGYRAGYILETMKMLRDESRGGEAYLRDVLCKTTDPTEVQTKLCDFKGVGRKVADCVALFSLKQDDAIPVDTHVWNIAIRDYDPEGTLKTNVKSLTPSNYRLVGDLFRSRFPNRAGWAHSLLFVAELPSFRALLPKDLANEMDEFQKEEKERKKELKKKKK
mmetsp:Transcript_22651/g.48025  ORF Transcript_22651/g.48025 Transcript_22651/m.48025 type:complete len:510 (+) Transcript_22651:2481-4010(+)